MSLLAGINESMAALLSGYQKAGIMSLIQMLGTLVQYAVIIIGLCLGFGFISMIAGVLGGSLFMGMGYYWKISRIGGKPSLVPAIPAKADFLAMAGYAGLLSIGFLSSLMREQTDKLVLARSRIFDGVGGQLWHRGSDGEFIGAIL